MATCTIERVKKSDKKSQIPRLDFRSLETLKPHSSSETSFSFDVMQVLTSTLLELPKLLHARIQERQGMIQEMVDNDKLQCQGEILQLIRHDVVCVDVAIPPQKPEFGNSVILVVGSDEKRIDLVIEDVFNRARMQLKVISPINITGREVEWFKSDGLQTLHSKISNQHDVCVVLLCSMNELRRVCDFMEKIFVRIENAFEEEEENMPIEVPTCSKNTIKKPPNADARKPMPSPLIMDTDCSKMSNPEMEQVLQKPITVQPNLQQQNLNVELERKDTETETINGDSNKEDVDDNKLDKKEAGICEDICSCIFFTFFDC